ncbi:threonine--tRNA ligase [Spirochaeta isovalerica]|uniref:Threonine--tRNA ligase n=1 Tax=Spirochaeta isovalerica TaxID=150 RepID=A0A841RH09_9SPIO|nr:threonine--tRNA ligase [Spirochaeta isovalerica]MBB6482487.1 threonyl-tRNA synthetase [Spirochaeta isovalerica]
MSDKEAKKLEKQQTMRHSMAHVMAGAVLKMFPDAKIAIGPAIENGFYYDFDLPRSITPDDLGVIEESMKEIIKSRSGFERSVVSKEEAKALFADQPYKLELIEELPETEEISVYQMGDFKDLCRGPHVEDTSRLNPQSFKLLKTAGAYWRGDEKRPMLQRIYGTAFSNPKDLKMHLQHLEEMEKRDHRKIGKELDLFSLHEEAGPGMVYWHPKGARIRVAIEDFWRQEHYKNGYEMVFTPHVGKSWLWETSGHLGFYNESMFQPMEMDKSDYYAKPMNCPFHIMIYNNGKHSYRELPFRWAELGTVYRYEKSGTLHGLMRVRGFTQDDAHIICTPDQVEDEILEVLRFSLFMLRSFGFEDISAYLSTMPEKSVGEKKDWDLATESLRKAIEKEGLEYGVDEGGGAFYGPKIDLKVKDTMGREWQLSTVQFDFNLSERFDMVFVDKDGKEKRPFMIHRALLGSIERFFGVLVENFGGAFPVWLSPVQAMVIPVSAKFDDYAKEVEKNFRAAGIRVETDFSDERMNAKIRNAQTQKIPYMIVVGENEMNEKAVSIRIRTGEQKNGMPMHDAVQMIMDKIESKELP